MKKEVQRCAKCGSCTVVCPVYKASGGKEFYSARGKKHLLEVMGEAAPSAVYEDIFSKCLLCGACEVACPRGVEVTHEVREARSGFSRLYGEYGYQKYLARKVLEKPELLSVARGVGRTFANLLGDRLPSDSGLRLKMAMFDVAVDEGVENPEEVLQPLMENEETLLYFPGCSSTHLYPEMVVRAKLLFQKLGYRLVIPDGLQCCGLAHDAAGDNETAKRLAKKNITAFDGLKGRILVSCGSCMAQVHNYKELLAEEAGWKKRAQLFSERAVEVSCLLDELLNKTEKTQQRGNDKKLRVFYHDPCHLRNELGITQEPRNVLRKFSQVELLELADGPQCCGQGGLFHLGAPELSATIRDDLREKVLAQKPDYITSSCSGCLMQWKTAIAASNKKIPVVHLVELLARLSHEHCDEIDRQKLRI